MDVSNWTAIATAVGLKIVGAIVLLSRVMHLEVTAEGIAQLRSTMPHFDADALAADPRVENIQSLLTVKMIVNFISRRVG